MARQPKPPYVWRMPEWMKPFEPLIDDTGGNPIETLVNDNETNARINLVRAVLCIAVKDQVTMLYRLARRGLLVGVPESVPTMADDGYGRTE